MTGKKKVESYADKVKTNRGKDSEFWNRITNKDYVKKDPEQYVVRGIDLLNLTKKEKRMGVKGLWKKFNNLSDEMAISRIRRVGGRYALLYIKGSKIVTVTEIFQEVGVTLIKKIEFKTFKEKTEINSNVIIRSVANLVASTEKQNLIECLLIGNEKLRNEILAQAKVMKETRKQKLSKK